MSKKQEALIRAIKAAQEAGGFLQKQLAAMACTSPGNICSALSGAGSMSVEKWRLLCEGLALDYDAIIAEAENTPAAEVQQEEPVRCESAAPVCEEIAPECESPVKISGGGYRVRLPGAQAGGGFAQRYGDADRRDVRAAGLHAGAEEGASMSKITVMVKEPGKPWAPREIENRLGDVQKLVGGYIEVVTMLDNLALIVDEEGKLKGKEPNFRLMGDMIVGTAVLVGVACDELTDIPEPNTLMDALDEAVMWCD